MTISRMSNNYAIPVANVSRVTPINTDNTVDSSSRVHSQTECQTCKNRKYVDGSNEADVSYKTPQNISPGDSFSKVLSHEREHVANAVQKTNGKKGAELVGVAVSLSMGVCAECGKTYVSGGTTSTQIKYNTTNPYEQNRKSADFGYFLGANLDAGA